MESVGYPNRMSEMRWRISRKGHTDIAVLPRGTFPPSIRRSRNNGSSAKPSFATWVTIEHFRISLTLQHPGSPSYIPYTLRGMCKTDWRRTTYIRPKIPFICDTGRQPLDLRKRTINTSKTTGRPPEKGPILWKLKIDTCKPIESSLANTACQTPRAVQPVPRAQLCSNTHPPYAPIHPVGCARWKEGPPSQSNMFIRPPTVGLAWQHSAVVGYLQRNGSRSIIETSERLHSHCM
jgi:hypothetical protein